MTDSNLVRKRDRRGFYRRAALAPLCLCLVAGLHVYRVYRCDQTPWKGGGFGMFSTVDERTARYARLYLVTPSGELPVRIPQVWEKRLTEIKAAPSQDGLEMLAKRLAELKWRDPRQQWESICLGAAAMPPNQPLAGQQLHPTNNWTGLPAAPFGSPLEVEPLPDDAPVEGALAVNSVRLELWRFELDAQTRTLHSRKHLEATARKAEEL